MIRKFFLFFGLIFITYVTIGMALQVGKLQEAHTFVVTWGWPIAAFIFTAVPFAFGYLGGRE